MTSTDQLFDQRQKHKERHEKEGEKVHPKEDYCTTCYEKPIPTGKFKGFIEIAEVDLQLEDYTVMTQDHFNQAIRVSNDDVKLPWRLNRLKLSMTFNENIDKDQIETNGNFNHWFIKVRTESNGFIL